MVGEESAQLGSLQLDVEAGGQYLVSEWRSSVAVAATVAEVQEPVVDRFVTSATNETTRPTMLDRCSAAEQAVVHC